MARKIGRIISNAFSGRRQFKEESLNFEETKALLKSLSERNCIKRRSIYYHPTKSEELFNKSETPHHAYGFISIFFNNSSHFKGQHQIYYDEKEEMHYIDISAKLKNKYRGASLEFLIENPPTTPRR